MPSVELNDADAVCSGNQLAAVIGVSPRQIDVLRAEGVLSCVRSKRRGRRYRLSEAVQRYITHEKQRVSEQSAQRNGSSAYGDARTRRMAALAQVEEMRARQLNGDAVNRARVVLVMTSLLSTIKNHVLAIPSRCTRQLVGQRDTNKVRLILDAACRDTLREASKFGSYSFDETSKNGAHSDGND
jgi:phage terminase Nu1 subunit (DNA packaging protein)